MRTEQEIKDRIETLQGQKNTYYETSKFNIDMKNKAENLMKALECQEQMILLYWVLGVE